MACVTVNFELDETFGLEIFYLRMDVIILDLLVREYILLGLLSSPNNILFSLSITYISYLGYVKIECGLNAILLGHDHLNANSNLIKQQSFIAHLKRSFGSFMKVVNL